MRTQVMQEHAVGALAYLEHGPRGGPVEKTVLATFPFTIGRNDEADLHIDSSQVSREHAIITRHGKKYRVRDLGSTNGTFVNGEQIEESNLGDGDLLTIAEVEFTFYTGASPNPKQTATQVRPTERAASAPSAASEQDTVWDAILAVRRTHETVTQRSVSTRFQPVVELASDTAFGYEAFAAGRPDDAGNPRCEQLTSPMQCKANDRLRQLFRRLAVEESVGLPHGGRLLLAITAPETAAPTLVAQLRELRELVGKRRQLVVEIPDEAVRSTADFRDLLARLREAQIEIAYDGYASGKVLITERKDVAPDFLKLAPSLFKSIQRGKDRQRQVQLIVRASHDIGATVIATGIDNEGSLDMCRELGCTLAQGEMLGRPQGVADLVQAARNRPAAK